MLNENKERLFLQFLSMLMIQQLVDLIVILFKIALEDNFEITNLKKLKYILNILITRDYIR